jgi:hypothetical protein
MRCRPQHDDFFIDSIMARIQRDILKKLFHICHRRCILPQAFQTMPAAEKSHFMRDDEPENDLIVWILA